MEARITDLNLNEILLYLGHRGQELTDDVKAQLEESRRLIKKYSNPRLVYREFEVANGEIKNFPLEGEDVKALLKDCDKAIAFAATLGPEIEKQLMKYEVTDMAMAVIMDSCASVAIENVCDNFEIDLLEDVNSKSFNEGASGGAKNALQNSPVKRYLTDRYSPGYGDLPLSSQKRFCEALNTEKRIGLTVTDNYLMIPRKSVTAIIGISDKEQQVRRKGCEVCSMFLNCSFRKEGTSCNH